MTIIRPSNQKFVFAGVYSNFQAYHWLRYRIGTLCAWVWCGSAASTSTRAFNAATRYPRAASHHTSYTFSASALYVFSFLPPPRTLFGSPVPPRRNNLRPLAAFHVTTASCAMSATEIQLRMCIWCTGSVACSVFGGLSICFLLILLLEGTGHTSPIKIWGHKPRLDASE